MEIEVVHLLILMGLLLVSIVVYCFLCVKLAQRKEVPFLSNQQLYIDQDISIDDVINKNLKLTIEF